MCCNMVHATQHRFGKIELYKVPNQVRIVENIGFG